MVNGMRCSVFKLGGTLGLSGGRCGRKREVSEEDVVSLPVGMFSHTARHASLCRERETTNLVHGARCDRSKLHLKAGWIVCLPNESGGTELLSEGDRTICGISCEAGKEVGRLTGGLEISG